MEEGSTYLVARDGEQPVGHAHIAWAGTHLGLPEIQDVFVVPEQRHRGIATQLTHAAEEEARARGWESISLSVSEAVHLRATSSCMEADPKPGRLTRLLQFLGLRKRPPIPASGNPAVRFRPPLGRGRAGTTRD
jgi:GNAT superfamily N-acetyltransferase